MSEISISYAQALEDIHLLRALKGINPDEGFYIDVGANDPEIDSVTKLFYDKGWTGINIDASPKWIGRLREQRPRDTNLEIAVSDVPGPVAFFDHAVGLGTSVRSIAEDHMSRHGIEMVQLTVATDTLTAICEAHAPSQIHFLKVDVEGSERAVLSSMDFERFRPWILCIECHYPMQPELQMYEAWEPQIIGSGYLFAHTDSINRYYVAEEHSERMASFAYPAHFYVHANVARRMQELETKVAGLEACMNAIKKIASTV